MYVDRFGWIPRPVDLQGSFGQLRTLPDFDEAVAWVRKYSDRDGYLYSPVQRIEVENDQQIEQGAENLALFGRPAHLYRIPPTHELRLSSVSRDSAIPRNTDAGFLMHFLGFLLGHRCQFWDWWVDARISVRSEADYHIVTQEMIGKCIDCGFCSWRQWSDRTRTTFINAMFLHNRSSGYLWDWERLQAEYQVLDAFYAVARSRFKRPKTTHSQRIEGLCKEFGLHWFPDLVVRIVSLRNELVHEALWGGQMPGTAPDDESFYMPIWLHKFNQRLGLAILGFANDYVRSRWNGLGTTAFRI